MTKFGNVHDLKDSEEIREVSEVVLETLNMLNDVSIQHQQSIANIASGICHEMVNLVRELNSVSKDKKISENDVKAIEKKYMGSIGKIDSKANTAQASLKKLLEKGLEGEVPYSFYKTAAIQALSNACHNAVTAQQQTNVIAQAAVQQGVICLYSVISSSIGIVDKK